MDTTEDAFEADATLDQGRLRKEQAKRAQAARNANIGHQHKLGYSTSASGEQTPLLDNHDDDEQEESDPSEPSPDDFAGLPWYSRPSIYWIIVPFFFVSVAFGGLITPKLNLQLELICRQYFSERQMADPSFVAIPIDFNGGANEQCRIPAVQSRASIFNLWSSIIAGLLSALTSPKLGLWSDHIGRKPILIICSMAAIFAEIITIIAATYPETFPVYWLLLAYAIDGLGGSFIVGMAVSNSYGADCTPPHLRNVSFAYLHGCLFTGFALGPIMAGYVVKQTGRIVTIFYILLGVHLTFVVFVALCVPESLSERRRKAARAKHDAGGYLPVWDWNPRNLFEPLRILWPKGAGTSTALRRNLIFLSAVDTIAFSVAIGTVSVLIIYVNYAFGWQTYESGRFISIVNACRVFCLIVVLPVLTRCVRGRPDASKQNSKGSDLFDLTLIRVAIFFDCLGFVGYSLARTPEAFTVAGVVAVVGGIGSPTLQSALTKHVPADNTGQLLGALGLLHCLARIAAPPIFNGIYAATVGKFDQAVFVCLGSTFGLAFILTWMIRPHVYYGDDATE